MILILLIVFIINLAGIYFVFYYDATAYTYINTGAVSGTFVFYNDKGDELAFFKKKGEIENIRIYNFATNDFKDYPLPETLEVKKADNLVFSPDSKQIVFTVKEGDDTVINLLNFDDGSVVSLKNILANPKLSYTDSGEPVRTISWLDNDRLVYVNSISFERNGVVIVNLKSGQEEKFINKAKKPKLSNDKTKLAYVVGSEDGKSIEVEVINLGDAKATTLVKDIKGYPNVLAWSGQDKKIALGYSFFDEKVSLRKVMIIDENGQVESISENKLLAAPQWADEDNIIVVEYQSLGVVVRLESVDGIYLYDIRTKEYKKITSKIQSESYSISPDKKKIISSMGNQGLLIIDIEATLKPNTLDKLRNYLGIHSL